MSTNGQDLIVDFPQQPNWQGLVSEMEVVPSCHMNVTCDGCGVSPITGKGIFCNEYAVYYMKDIFCMILKNSAYCFLM